MGSVSAEPFAVQRLTARSIYLRSDEQVERPGAARAPAGSVPTHWTSGWRWRRRWQTYRLLKCYHCAIAPVPLTSGRGEGGRLAVMPRCSPCRCHADQSSLDVDGKATVFRPGLNSTAPACTVTVAVPRATGLATSSFACWATSVHVWPRASAELKVATPPSAVARAMIARVVIPGSIA
jgi:hypothetical protein